jgi:hypothetical protein
LTLLDILQTAIPNRIPPTAFVELKINVNTSPKRKGCPARNSSNKFTNKFTNHD